MNRSAMPRALFVSLLSALLVACQAQPAAQEPPLAGSSIGGPFELVDRTGKTVRWSDFDGKYRVVYFGYAYCPDVCPLDVNRMMRGIAGFANSEPALAAEIVPIFISIDPQRDTPEVVGEFTDAFAGALTGLTGTPEQVEQAAKAFGVFYARGEGTEDNYLMQHSRGAYLMGRHGEPLASLPVEQSPDAVAAELEKWVS